MYYRSTAISNTFDPKWEFETLLNLLPDSSQELSIVVFDEDPDNGGDTLVGELCLGVDCIIETLKVKSIVEEWLDMDYCNKGQIMISAKMATNREEEENPETEEEEQYNSPNTMTHEEAVRRLEAEEEKSRITSEIQENEHQAVPGHCEGESSKQKAERIEEDINVPPKNQFHVHFVCFLVLSFTYFVALSLV